MTDHAHDLARDRDRIRLDADFLASNIRSAVVAYFAPIAALIGTVKLVGNPDIDAVKAVARMRRPERLALHPRDLALKYAEDDGLTLNQLLADIAARYEEVDQVDEEPSASGKSD